MAREFDCCNPGICPERHHCRCTPLLRRGLRRLEAAAGVAESGDRLQGRPGREGRILQAGRSGASRNGSLADKDRKGGVGQSANAHGLLRAVDGDGQDNYSPARARRYSYPADRARHRRLLVSGIAHRPSAAPDTAASASAASRERASPSIGSRRDNRGHAMFLHFKPDRDSELDDCRETRGDHHGVAQRSLRCRVAITAVSRVDIVSRGRAAAHQAASGRPKGGRHSLASVIERQRE